MKKQKTEVSDLSSLLDKKYGPTGSPERDAWERSYQAFKLGLMIAHARKARNMTQDELAQKCGTSKSYISRIENDASDIRFSTLQRIIHEGLNGRLIMKII